MTARDANGRFVSGSGVGAGPMVVSGSIVGAENVVQRLSVVLPGRALARMRDAVHALGFLLERRVKLEKLAGQVLGRVSGRLARSVNTRFIDASTSSTAIVGTNLSYGRIWELTGSRAFTIVPTHAKALFWPGAQHPVRSVFHPAQSPRPFLAPALQEMRPTIRATIAEAMTALGGHGGNA